MQAKNGCSVLLIEDDSSTRRMLTTYLNKVGYEVTSVESAEEVLPAHQSREGPFDVIVTDVHLPGMSGTRLVNLLRAALPDQPIVVMSGDPQVLADALSSGADRHLAKPFHPFELEVALWHATGAGYPELQVELHRSDRKGAPQVR